MGICAIRKEGKLNQKLLKLFPNKETVEGISDIYNGLRTNPEFLEQFGDWTDEDVNKELQEKLINTGVLNRQGEPEIHVNSIGPHVIIPGKKFLEGKTDMLQGTPYYLNVRLGVKALKAQEMSQIVNSLTGSFINESFDEDSPNERSSLSAFITKKLTSRLNELEGKKEILAKELKELRAAKDKEGAARVKKARTVLNTTIDKLSNLLENDYALTNLAYRIDERLKTQKFKLSVTENVDEGDQDGHEDILNFVLDANESSNRKGADIEVLKLLSSVPLFNEDGEVRTNPIMGDTLYMNQSAVWHMLESIFADEIITSEGGSLYDRYLNAISNKLASVNNKSLRYVYDFLRNIDNTHPDPENFKIKFKRSMHKAVVHYVFTELIKDGTTISVGVKDPSRTHSQVGKITTKFIDYIVLNDNVDVSLIKEQAKTEFKKLKKKPDPAKYEAFLTDLLINKLRVPVKKNSIKSMIVSESLKSFSNLNFLINRLLDEKNNKFTNSEGDPIVGELGLVNALKSKKTRADIKSDIKDSLLYSGNFFHTLAGYEANFTDKDSEATVYIGAKQRWLYSFVTQMQMEVAKMKEGKSSRVANLKGHGFKIIEYLNEGNNLDNIKVIFNTELKTKNDPNPVLHKNITPNDLHFDNLIKMFYNQNPFLKRQLSLSSGVGAKQKREEARGMNYLIYNFGADKNSLFALHGIPNPIEGMPNIFDTSKNEIGKDFKKLLDGYVKGELLRIQRDTAVVEKYLENPSIDVLMTELVPNYHYVLDKNDDIEDPEFRLEAKHFQRGQYYKLGVFSNSFDKFLENDYFLTFGEYRNENSTPILDPSFIGSKANKRLMGIIYKDVTDQMIDNYKYLSNLLMIRDTPDGKEAPAQYTLFDIASNLDLELSSPEQILYSYIAASFAIAYETSNIFNGHISFYKQSPLKDNKGKVLKEANENITITDFLKRAPAVGSSGSYVTVDKSNNNTKDYYPYAEMLKPENQRKPVKVKAETQTVVAVVNSIENKTSKHLDLIKAGYGRQIRGNYEHEVADAQGYITPGHFKDMMTRIYGWTMNDEHNYQELLDPDHPITRENIEWLKKSNKGFTPKKFTYFNVGANNIPVYLKYSVAPLFPALVNGTMGQRIVQQMEAQGVEQLVFKSGSKASNAAPTTIHTSKDGIFTGIKEEFALNPFLIETEFLKVQTEIPTKLNTSIALGNQVIKNILVNMDMDSDVPQYRLDGKMLTGKELYNEFETSIKNILQVQLNQVLSNLGYDKKNAKFNVRNIKKFLTNQMEIETERDLLNFLDTDLPLETIPNLAQRAFPVIARYIEKNAGKVYTNGASVVQVANVGFDQVINKDMEDRVMFFENSKRELTPPLPKTFKDLNKKQKENIGKELDPDAVVYFDAENKAYEKPGEGRKMQINKARILLPFTQIFKDSDISYNEFQEMWKSGKVDKKIMKKIIGYRIPNQARASIDSFEIVGILPPIAGDQAVVYHEITAKTGSDFDIDKMYLMMPMIKMEGQEYVIPEEESEEYNKRRDAILEGTKKVSFDDVNELVWLHGKNGAQIVEALRNDEEFADFYDALGPDHAKNISITLKNYDDLLQILQKNGTTIEDYDGSRLPLSVILQNVKSNNSKRRELTKERLKERYKKLETLNRKFGERKPERIGLYESNNEFKENSKNRLIDIYNSILEAEDTYDDLMSPLDDPRIKNAINKIAYEKAKAMGQTESTESEFLVENQKTALEQIFPKNLVKARTDVLEAKSLIAAMANHMTDLGESQKVGFEFKYDFGLGTKDLARIYELGKDNKPDHKISKNVSYGMNASVDAAKDPYIIDGNFTTYTANVGIMLMRLGIEFEDALHIMMNQTIMDYSEERVAARGKSTNIRPLNNAKELDNMSRSLIVKLKEGKNIFDIVPREDWLSNNPEQVNNFLGFWNILMEAGKELNNSVVAMKSDSNGPGKNIAEMMVLANRLDRMTDDSLLNGSKKWFRSGLNSKNRKFTTDINDNKDMTFLGAFANNTLFLMEAVAEQTFLEATPKVKSTVNRMAGMLGSPSTTDAGMIRLLNNYLYPYLLYRTGNPLYKFQEGEADELIDNFPSELEKKRVELKDNAFLNELVLDTTKKDEVIKFLNSDSFSKEEIVKLKESLEEVYLSDPEFTRKLVRYAYVTTGFKPTLFSFNQFLPTSFFINEGNGVYIKKFMDDKFEVIDPSQALAIIAKKNHNNYKIVRKAYSEGNINYITKANDKLLEELELPNPLGEKAYRAIVKRRRTKGPDTIYVLNNITDEGLPEYSRLSEVEENTTHKVHDYANLEEVDIYATDVYYFSKINELFDPENHPSTQTASREDFNEELQEVDTITATSGLTIRELGYTQDSWDALTEEEQQEIIKCH